MKTDKEEWKSIPNYLTYQVSDLGRVKSLKCDKERILKGSNDGRGYLKVNLRKEGKQKTKKIHQLVAIAFLSHNPCGMELVVDHKNGIRTDNRLENLQLITARENNSKDRKGGTSKYVGVCWYKNYNKWLASITINGKKKNLGYFKMEYTASIAYQTALHDHLNK